LLGTAVLDPANADKMELYAAAFAISDLDGVPDPRRELIVFDRST
jgi:hypothetical protein